MLGSVSSEVKPTSLRSTSATRAGVGRMIATHIQPWTPKTRVASEIRQTWSGPLDFAEARMVVSF